MKTVTEIFASMDNTDGTPDYEALGKDIVSLKRSGAIGESEFHSMLNVLYELKVLRKWRFEATPPQYRERWNVKY